MLTAIGHHCTALSRLELGARSFEAEATRCLEKGVTDHVAGFESILRLTQLKQLALSYYMWTDYTGTALSSRKAFQLPH